MSADLERKLSLFEAASELTDPARRRAFLKAACAGETTLLHTMEKLLSAGERVDEFFADCAPDHATISEALESRGLPPAPLAPGDPSALVGTSIGNYKLLQKIGEGGCGVVYMAEQSAPVRRRVALKVIKLGMDTKSVIARFEAERQALAMMDHPNIARVLDAGATEAGRPFFAMELVNGVKITEYCDQQRLGVEGRLEMFIEICHAIQHAHQKGIIHRDIKPSNILVTAHLGAPAPKVIDFGIAKATEEQLTDKTLFTACTQLIGTPAYMSPEQLDMGGADLDTRSDIYSLGVLLYELLTGRTPFDTKELMKAGLDEMRRTLKEREPRSPSATLHTLRADDLTQTAMQRRMEAPRLLLQLRGDLDWIVMKALEKDRSRRYETADAMATDVRRYLDNEPILARPPSRWYQLRKLVRRNRVVFASAGAVATALLIGTVVSTSLFLKERAAEREQSLLRQEAEARARLNLAGLLAARQQYDEAEKLLPAIDLTAASPDLATLLRSLGDWHALAGRWGTAASRFQALVRVEAQQPPGTLTIDYSELAAALIEANDKAGFERFRHDTIAQFTGVDDLTVERIIKCDLLLPADSRLLTDLQPLAEIVEKSLAKLTKTNRIESNHTAWVNVSLGLWNYRRGDYAMAEASCQRGLNDSRLSGPGIATANLILAMSCWQMDEKAQALSQWSTAESLIDARFQKGLSPGTGSLGFWYDWVLARALSRECQQLFARASATPVQPTRDTAATWRALGEWHALRGEWSQAAACYQSSLRLDQYDPWKDYSVDQLACGVALVEAGDLTGYERFRSQEAARFKDPGANTIAITTLIAKACLLRPADDKLLAALMPMVNDLAAPFSGHWNAALLDYYDGWRCVTMGLAEYRRGNFASAVTWSRRSLGCVMNIPPRTAAARVILAMALQRLGRDDDSQSELQQARNLIEGRFATPLDYGSADHGLWFDWIISRMLLDEAAALPRQPQAAPAFRQHLPALPAIG
jgi:serine/threonine protein kinase